MYATITKDRLYESDPGYGPSEVGPLYTGDPVPTGSGIIQWRMKDDDGIVYYEGVSDDDALEGVMDWGCSNAGCTILETLDDGAWVVCIG